jgi:hypothetical protein
MNSPPTCIPPPAEIQPPSPRRRGIIPWLRHLSRLALAGLAAGVLVVAGGGIVTGLALTGPSWPHPWCGATMTAMYDSPAQTFGAYTNQLQYLENIGAPTAQLLADENQLSSDQIAASDDSVFNLFTDLDAEDADNVAIKADAVTLNNACGKPASYGPIGNLAVPAASS